MSFPKPYYYLALRPTFTALLLSACSWARKHFDCKAIKAVFMEDEGGSGTAFTHWEQTLFAVSREHVARTSQSRRASPSVTTQDYQLHDGWDHTLHTNNPHLYPTPFTLRRTHL